MRRDADNGVPRSRRSEPEQAPSVLPLAIICAISGGVTVLVIQYAAHAFDYLIRSVT